MLQLLTPPPSSPSLIPHSHPPSWASGDQSYTILFYVKVEERVCTRNFKYLYWKQEEKVMYRVFKIHSRYNITYSYIFWNLSYKMFLFNKISLKWWMKTSVSKNDTPLVYSVCAGISFSFWQVLAFGVTHVQVFGGKQRQDKGQRRDRLIWAIPGSRLMGYYIFPIFLVSEWPEVSFHTLHKCSHRVDGTFGKLSQLLMASTI